MGDIQKITEQARVHRQILERLEAEREEREKREKDQKASGLNEKDLLAKEKIRLIQGETQKSREFIDSLEKDKAPVQEETQDEPDEDSFEPFDESSSNDEPEFYNGDDEDAESSFSSVNPANQKTNPS